MSDKQYERLDYHWLIRVHVSDVADQSVGVSTAPLTNVAVHHHHEMLSSQVSAVAAIL